MKKAALFLLAGGMVLSGCNYDAGLGGNSVIYNEKGVGVGVDDSGSAETATKKIDEKGKVTWTQEDGKGVTFTFMTRPGADAAYIKGYRVTSQNISTRGEIVRGTPVDVRKMNLYLTSGHICSERTALRSCVAGADGTVIGNGVPAKANIYLEDGLASEVIRTEKSVGQATTIEFFGFTANGTPFTVTAKGVVSRGIKKGDR